MTEDTIIVGVDNGLRGGLRTTPRSKVPHDGIVDAALIARYYRDANR
jgi:hypothetical protein